MKVTPINFKSTDFERLGIGRDVDGITYDADALHDIVGDDLFDQLMATSDENLTNFIATWYAAHVQQGGKRNAVIDDFIEEHQIELDKGTVISKGGNA